MFEIVENMNAEVSMFMGKPRIDIRKWFMDKKREEYRRGKNGLNLSVEEWENFVAKFDELKEFVNSELEKEK